MERIVRTVTDGIMQITVADERWYVREILRKKKVVGHEFVPSVTWITGFYPKGVAFYQWLAKKGWDEAEAIKTAAGEKGTRVHKAIEQLLQTGTVSMTDQFRTKDAETFAELTVDEYEAVHSFLAWYRATQPKLDAAEITVWNSRYNYAGTVDLILEINGEPWIVDIKTGSAFKQEWELQVSAYARCIGFKKKPRLAILQVGYRHNKNRYKFTEVEDRFNLFLATRQIWAAEVEKKDPPRVDLPVVLSLTGSNEAPEPRGLKRIDVGKTAKKVTRKKAVKK